MVTEIERQTCKSQNSSPFSNLQLCEPKIGRQCGNKKSFFLDPSRTLLPLQHIANLFHAHSCFRVLNRALNCSIDSFNLVVASARSDMNTWKLLGVRAFSSGSSWHKIKMHLKRTYAVILMALTAHIKPWQACMLFASPPQSLLPCEHMVVLWYPLLQVQNCLFETLLVSFICALAQKFEASTQESFFGILQQCFHLGCEPCILNTFHFASCCRGSCASANCCGTRVPHLKVPRHSAEGFAQGLVLFLCQILCSCFHPVCRSRTLFHTSLSLAKATKLYSILFPFLNRPISNWIKKCLFLTMESVPKEYTSRNSLSFIFPISFVVRFPESLQDGLLCSHFIATFSIGSK